MKSVFELEKHMVQDWEHEVPKYVFEVLGHETAEEVEEEARGSGPIGIGYTEETGWYILMSGQGPFIHWVEKGEIDHEGGQYNVIWKS